jgi:hypothetical protein
MESRAGSPTIVGLLLFPCLPLPPTHAVSPLPPRRRCGLLSMRHKDGAVTTLRPQRWHLWSRTEVRRSSAPRGFAVDRVSPPLSPVGMSNLARNMWPSSALHVPPLPAQTSSGSVHGEVEELEAAEHAKHRRAAAAERVGGDGAQQVQAEDGVEEVIGEGT